MERDPIALELYTVRDQLKEDFAGTVRKVAEIGYPAVELAGYGGLSAPDMRALLRETGLEAAGTHVSLDALRSDLDGQIAYCTEIGCAYLVVASAPREERGAEAMRAVTRQLDEMGRACRQQGLSLGYHNHDFEFQEVDGQPLLEYMMAETDPQAVTFELDVYWAAFAGHDPVDFLRRHADRISLLHMKDMDADRRYTEVGEGTLELGQICATGREVGVRWFIVEHDEPRIPSLESARISFQNLRSLLGGSEVGDGR